MSEEQTAIADAAEATASTEGETSAAEAEANGNDQEQAGTVVGSATENPTEGDTSADGATATAGAPEEYETFSVPEGVELGETRTAEITATVKDLNLPQDQAQKVVDLIANKEAADNKAFNDMVEANVSAIKSRPEFTAEQAAVARARDQLMPDGLKDRIANDPAWGNDPHLFEFLASLGAKLAEADMGDTGKSEGTPTRAADNFYKKANKQE